jgi:GNAT superfamily N-acetyltransferase
VPIHRVADAAFRDTPGYLHVPVDVVADFYRPLRTAIDPRLALLARDPEDRVAAFLVGLPGPTTRAARAFQVLMMAVDPGARSNGVATWLLGAAHQAARKAGYATGLHTVSAEALERPRWRQGDVVREYALFRRAL